MSHLPTIEYPSYLTKITGVLTEDRFECTMITAGSYTEELKRKILTSNNHQITRILEAEYKSENHIMIYLSDQTIMAVGLIDIRH